RNPCARRQLRLPEQVFHRRDRIPLSGAAAERADPPRPGTFGGRLPGAGLRRLGARRPHARRAGPALPARTQYVARDDRPFPRADGVARRRCRLRYPGPARPRRCRAEDALAPTRQREPRTNPWHDARALGRVSAGLAAGALACLVLAAAAWAAGRPVFDPRAGVIQPIDERPLRYVAERPLEQALQAAVKGSFFSTELEAVRERVETVPWVRHASVRRIWPDRLEVRIEEHRPLALWHDGRLVNTYRELFAANLDEAEEDGPLPQLSGPPGSEAEVVERFLAASRLVEPLDRVPVSVSMSARRAWRMQLDDGTVLLLGRERSRSIDSRIAR